MTDDLPPTPRADDEPGSGADELVSSVLDGEATEREAAEVASDPALSARLDDFRTLRDDHVAVVLEDVRADSAGPGSTGADLRIAAVLGRLDAASVSSTDDPLGDGAPAVAPLDVRSRSRRRLPLVGAAAAAVVLVVALAALAIGTRDGGETYSSAADSAGPGSVEALTTTTVGLPTFGGSTDSARGSAADGAASERSSAESADPAPAMSTNPRAITDLGDFTTRADLLVAAAAAPILDPADVRCPAPFPTGSTVHVGSARLLGRPVITMYGSTGAGGDELEVFDAATCELVT